MATKTENDDAIGPQQLQNLSEKGSEHFEDDISKDNVVDTEFQAGVQKIEAVTIAWTKTSMIIAFALIWLIYFVQGLVGVINGALLPFVTSAFAAHSLTATTGVVSAIVGGVFNLIIAKILDVFGRPQGFFFSAVLATIGLIMSAACNDVEAYAASQVFYTVGINGIGYSVSVVIADITKLHNRGLYQAVASSPNLITIWVGGPVATAFLTNGGGWRWGFGLESILVPAVAGPLFGLFVYRYRQAKKQGIAVTRPSGRTAFRSIIFYLEEFDVIGLVSLMAGVSFFLLPFNLYTQQAKGWDSGLVIGFLVAGIVLLIWFGIWERFFAEQSFMPWVFMRNRTVIGAMLSSFAIFFSNGCWALYFSSILQVVNNLSVTEASYVNATLTVGSVTFAIVTGGIMSYTGRFKALTTYVAVPLWFLGTGLMIYFRQPNGDIGYIVMCIIFISIGSGIATMTIEIAILAAMEKQQYFAIAVAMVSTVGSIGSAVGLTVSAAVWQHVFPEKLALYLPQNQLPNLLTIYGDLTTQLSYPIGSPTRLAIQQAYSDGQKYLFTSATCAWVIGAVGILMWSDLNLKAIKQTKGRVF